MRSVGLFRGFALGIFSGASAVICAAGISPFSAQEGKLSDGWKPFSFAKVKINTQYSLTSDPSKGAVLRARAEQGASALKHELDQPLASAPTLKWSWKVLRAPVGSNAHEKQGDDYAARLYVTFHYDPTKVPVVMRAQYAIAKGLYGSYPPHSAISYIVEPNLPVGTMVKNPFTDRVMMIVVDNGMELNTWHSFERNVAADYQKAFGVPPPNVSGLVIMTDADNTQTSAEALYGAITLE